MSRWRISRVRVSVATVVWITLVWVFLWGEVSSGNILAGVLVGLVVQTLLPLPTVGYHGRIRIRSLAYLIYRFVVDLVVASFQVAFLALNRRHLPHPGVVKVQLRSSADLYVVIVSELASLVPGSVVVEGLRRNGVVYVHILDIEGSGGVEGVRQVILDIEKRVLMAMASDEELEAAGLRAVS
jgi:multicomponent Na+:H+ antiporter subunit E